MARKAHGSIAFLLNSIDGNDVNYKYFLDLYKDEAEHLVEERIPHIFIDKINYTAFISELENWLRGNHRKILPKPRKIDMKFFQPNLSMGNKNGIQSRINKNFYYFITEELNLEFILGQ